MSSAPTPSPAGDSTNWLPPSPEELQALLPQYEITALIGRGGMGAVYRGRQANLDRPVAIKILPPGLDETDATFSERFRNEALAMAKLNHPGLVAVYDFGKTSNGMLYIVMEFVDGTDVAQMMAKKGRLSSEHAMAITAHVCDALKYAHERGIVHRDIKPANIMVGYDGVVKVADFGLAKMSQSGQSVGLTQSGLAMGTMHYIAPEALTLGASVDQRADIYAMGVMLYHMLTGGLPHGMFELPSLQVPGLDPRYDGIISRALRNDRERRYQNVGELRHDLDAILTQPVTQVNADAKKAPAALNTTARPQRPAGPPQRSVGQPQRTPQKHAPLPQPPRQKSNLGLWVPVVGVLVVCAGFVVWMERTKSDASKSSAAVAGDAHKAPTIAEATKGHPFTNSFGMKFVPVPGTKVLMCVHETRRRDYAAYAAEVGDTDNAWKNSVTSSGIPVGNLDDHPVVCVSQEDGKQFCEWLSKKERVAYRLMTDREWSMAVGNGDNEETAKNGTLTIPADVESDKFPWGKWPLQKGSGNYADVTWLAAFPNEPKSIVGYTDGFATTAPVMSFDPNVLGIFDMGGNVWEVVSDTPDGRANSCAIRGGSWDTLNRDRLLSSARLYTSPNHRDMRHGFRCVLETGMNELSAKTTSTNSSTTSGAPSAQSKTIRSGEAFTNSLGMKFVPVPGTDVLMCIHETRNQDYKSYASAVRGVNPSPVLIDKTFVDHADDHPVRNAKHDDAVGFCKWLSSKEGKTYRLPSDQEWSFAMGIGQEEKREASTTPEMLNGKLAKEFPWGSQWPPPKNYGNFADTSWKEAYPTRPFIDDYADGFATTAPVMSFQPNSLGLYDMSGNLSEWVQDWWNAQQKDRTIRGAGYASRDKAPFYASFRLHLPPSVLYNNANIGFRCVVELAPAKTAGAASSAPVNTLPVETGFTTLLTTDHLQDWKYDGTGYIKEDAGVFMLTGGGMFWYEPRAFFNHVLRLDFKVMSDQDNSGVFIRGLGAGKYAWGQGYEVEILGQKTGQIVIHKASTDKPPPLRLGEWNSFEITANGSEIVIRLNDVVINTYLGKENKAGQIALAGCDGGMQFRNVRIKELPDSQSSPAKLKIRLFEEQIPTTLNSVFAPLKEKSAASLRQSLTAMPDELISEGKAQPAASLDAYRAAHALCVALISAMDERAAASSEAAWSARSQALRPVLEDLHAKARRLLGTVP
ncbi:MAG: SUMF1/EgtB/PvdO family nonheme iron enzyme [Verrucomicrobia bacterium]|nr:SUMF1/EgtB/PvdO family nonheme iron enzyme [Verrucomicrobiota bacterium]